MDNLVKEENHTWNSSSLLIIVIENIELYNNNNNKIKKITPKASANIRYYQNFLKIYNLLPKHK